VKEVRVVIWDDLDGFNGLKIPAGVTYQLSVQAGDEKPRKVEVDLTEDHARELEEFLRQYFMAGEKQPATEPGQKKRHSSPGLRTRRWEHGQEYGKGIRAFADDRGISYGQRLTPQGYPNYYYPRALREKYAQHLLGTGAISPEDMKFE